MLVHDFTDPEWDTRFLGDLYQDLSEEARKKYALLQTPEFVEEFILDRTLDPAIEEFGLAKMGYERDLPDGRLHPDDRFKMIDPACGSGHFLLGGFARHSRPLAEARTRRRRAVELPSSALDRCSRRRCEPLCDRDRPVPAPAGRVERVRDRASRATRRGSRFTSPAVIHYCTAAFARSRRRSMWPMNSSMSISPKIPKP